MAEIGVWAGDLSRKLWGLETVKRLWLVDPMDTEHLQIVRDGKLRGFGNMGKPKDEVWSQAELDEIWESVVNEAPAHVVCLRLPSVEAARMIPDGGLDFVFIDSLHYYEDLCEDIETWKPKLCAGGILAGDDCYRRFPGVKKALDEKLPGYRLAGKIWWRETNEAN